MKKGESMQSVITTQQLTEKSDDTPKEFFFT